jgi:uncharacterized damage-inducible protein DinB
MTDETFINNTIQKGIEAKEKVRSQFLNISERQLNWKPTETSWSIAQCLDHLMVSHNNYFPILKKVSSGNSKMNFWERNSPLTKLFGKLLIDQLQEEVKTKRKAPKILHPTASAMKIDMVRNYDENLDQFLNSISNCRKVDLDKTIITSPVYKFVTYSLRDAFQFLLQHEHRHINQAIRVKASENFPQN